MFFFVRYDIADDFCCLTFVDFCVLSIGTCCWFHRLHAYKFWLLWFAECCWLNGGNGEHTTVTFSWNLRRLRFSQCHLPELGTLFRPTRLFTSFYSIQYLLLCWGCLALCNFAGVPLGDFLLLLFHLKAFWFCLTMPVNMDLWLPICVAKPSQTMNKDPNQKDTTTSHQLFVLMHEENEISCLGAGTGEIFQCPGSLCQIAASFRNDNRCDCPDSCADEDFWDCSNCSCPSICGVAVYPCFNRTGIVGAKTRMLSIPLVFNCPLTETNQSCNLPGRLVDNGICDCPETCTSSSLLHQGGQVAWLCICIYHNVGSWLVCGDPPPPPTNARSSLNGLCLKTGSGK